jgi:hypothetical protein
MNQPQDKIEGAPLIRPSTTDHPLYDQVVEACRTVFDPEIPVNIYDLGLVYTIEINDQSEVESALGHGDDVGRGASGIGLYVGQPKVGP